MSDEVTGSIGDATVTADQTVEIRRIITGTEFEPADLDMDLSVGIAVPDTVMVHPLPPRIVEIVPAYENHRYFTMSDGRIVIVEPDTMEVVAIVS